MSDWKESVPKPIKRLYRQGRKLVLNPQSDWRFSKQYGDKLQITYGDITAAYDTSDLVAKRWFYPRYRDGSLHEPVVTRALIERLGPESVFFDVGANVGFYTILASHCCNHVCSFEMDPRLASIIESHTAHNAGRTAEIEVVLSAVSDETGDYISFTPHITDNPSTNSVSTASNANDAPLRVPTVSLDAFAKKRETQPDLLKIDVEGFEMAALDGGPSILSDVESMFLEVHPTLMDRYGYTTADVFDVVRGHDFDVRYFTDHRADAPPDTVLEPISDPAVVESNTMLLCTK